MKIDPRSPRIVLTYTGNDAGDLYLSGIPARDLSENDLAALAVRADTSTDALIDELLTGPYRKSTPTKPEV